MASTKTKRKTAPAPAPAAKRPARAGTTAVEEMGAEDESASEARDPKHPASTPKKTRR